MFNFTHRTKLLISAFTFASAISATAVVAQLEPTMEVENQTTEQPQMSDLENESTIVDIASSSDSFETLTSALEAADLVPVLEGEGPFTVFAPTDDAFAALPSGTLDDLLKPEKKEILAKILKYHVVPGKVMSTDLKPGEVTTVEGSTVTVELGDQVKVNQAQVVETDIMASNGVIHVIDKVITPTN